MPHLFSPIQIKHVQFPNRLAMPPMVRLVSDMTREVTITAGRVTPAVIDYYLARVRAGTGTIVIEATAVDPAGRCWENGFCLYADEHTDNLAQLAAAIRAAGARSILQLVHGGPQADAPLSGGPLFGPSAIRANDKQPIPRELTTAEINAIQQRFADAACRAAIAGFDAVEVHGAHGYLLDSFLMQKRNHRTDAYGQDAAGRMRMLLETCTAVRNAVADKLLVACRISPFTKRDEPYTRDDFAALLRGLQSAGVDLIHLSTDGAFKTWFDEDQSLGQIARRFTNLPLMIAGGLREPAEAQRLITENHADFAALGTAMLRNPNWPTRARAELQPPAETP